MYKEFYKEIDSNLRVYFIFLKNPLTIAPNNEFILRANLYSNIEGEWKPFLQSWAIDININNLVSTQTTEYIKRTTNKLVNMYFGVDTYISCVSCFKDLGFIPKKE